MKFDRESLKGELMNNYADDENELDIQRAMDGHFGSKLKIIVPVMLVLIAGAVSYAWYTKKFALVAPVNENVPIVHADVAPVRVKPQDPGGMVIPGRGKMVYDHISKDKEQEGKQVTHVMPKAEEPINRGALIQDDTESTEGESVGQAIKKLDLPEPVAEEAEGSDEALAAVVTPETATPAPTVPHEVAEPEPAVTVPAPAAKKLDLDAAPAPVKEKVNAAPVLAPAKVTALDLKKSAVPIRKGEVLTLPSPSKKQGNYIQLGSFRNQSEVAPEWQKIQKSYPDLLKGLGYISEKADLNNQGIFYRLQVGPFKSERDARKVCQSLTERKQRCFFVK
jgi:hypothetical protein